MSAAVAPGAAAVALPAAPEAPVATPDASADPVADARAEARKLLFEGKSEESGGDEEPTKPEGQPKPKPEEKPDEDLVQSKKWAKLRAQEDRLVKRQKEFAEEQKAWGERTKTIEAREAAIAEREALVNDPLALLSKAGWTKEKIVEWIQSDGKVDPELLIKQISEKHQREIEELRAERAREREELEGTKRQREFQRVEGALYAAVSDELKSGEDLGLLQKLIAKNPKQEAFLQRRVGEVIRTVWDKTQEVVAPRDALLYLQQELAAIQLADPGPAPAVKPANPAAVEPRPITNQATSQRSVQPLSNYDESDPEARRARARAVLSGELPEE